MHHSKKNNKKNTEEIILPLKGRKTDLHVVQKMSHPLVFLVALPILNLLQHSFPGKFSSSVWPWQVLERRNVLTRNDAQQSLEKAQRERERESDETISRSESESAYPLPCSHSNRYWIGQSLFLSCVRFMLFISDHLVLVVQYYKYQLSISKHHVAPRVQKRCRVHVLTRCNTGASSYFQNCDSFKIKFIFPTVVKHHNTVLFSIQSNGGG